MWLLCVRLSRADSSGTADPRGQSHASEEVMGRCQDMARHTGDDTNLSPGSTVAAPETAPETAPTLALEIAPSPHLVDANVTTRRAMIDVVIALLPATVMSVVAFHWYAVVQVGLCVLSCVAAEWLVNRVARQPLTLGDGTAVVTGMILGLSLPWSAHWYVAVIGSCAAIGLGKAVFGGLGHNIFNPAMVGRAFVMLSFAGQMGAAAYVRVDSELAVVTRPTPLTLAKQFAADLAAGRVTAGDAKVQLESAESIWGLLVGQANGSLGETSALAILLGGCYLLWRRVISWEIPAGVILIAFVCTELGHLTNLTHIGPLNHLINGSLLFGALFIATDPVTSPVT
ncbi:MAG: RnfABCDGE type electron transport complex subunit D, partial [Planctomycetes bacterium]|nr:RnfABCDGE type electron transport complex subunit D [Planctomycetota bacterium]